MPGPDVEQLTLFQEDSRANLFPWPESKKEKKITDICGQKCCELSERYIRLISSVRTCLESYILPQTTFVRTWSVRATKSGYSIMKLRLSEQSIDEKGSSLWATPNTMDSLPSRSYEAMKRQATNGGRKNRKRPGNLREQIDPLMNQAYAEARMEANGLWPTPNTSDQYYPNLPHDVGRGYLRAEALPNQNITSAEARANGTLNPTWVEWLMGFPLGWTDLNA